MTVQHMFGYECLQCSPRVHESIAFSFGIDTKVIRRCKPAAVETRITMEALPESLTRHNTSIGPPQALAKYGVGHCTQKSEGRCITFESGPTRS